MNVASLHIPILHTWWGKNRVSCTQLSVICSVLSTLRYLCFCCYFSHIAWTEISVDGFLFMLEFPSWDRNRCFPSCLVVHKAGSAGQTWGDGSLTVFSHGRVRSVILPGSSTAAPEADPEYLGHPYSSLPTCLHFPPQDQGSRRPDDGGAGFSLRLRETWCPLPMGFIWPTQDQKGCAVKQSKLHRLGWKVLDHNLTYTQNNYSTATFTQHPSIYSKLCILALFNGWKETP